MAHITAQLASKVASFHVTLNSLLQSETSSAEIELESFPEGAVIHKWKHPDSNVIKVGDRIVEVDCIPAAHLDIIDIVTRIRSSSGLVLKLERVFSCSTPAHTVSQAAHTAHDEELAVASMMVSSGNAAVNLEHLATGCNRSCESCDWGPDDLVAYAGGHTIILFSLSDAGKCSFRDILVGHRARTNCVSWVRTPSGQYTEAKYVVSGSTDNDVRVWRKGSVDGRFSCRAQLAHHTGAVMGLACMSVTTTAGETITICSTSADNNVGIWRATVDESTTSTSDAFTLLQTISMGNGFALALALSVLPASDGSLVPVLAIGGDDAKIRVYTEAPQTSTETTSTEVFRFGVAVPGHEDWVRTLAFAATLPMGVDAESPPRAPASAPEPPALYLASGAQDTYIRIWRISEQSMSEASSESADATTAFARSSLHRNAMKDFDRCFAVDALHSESSEESSQPSPPVSYAVRLDALLVGHDNWVYSVRWHPPVYQASCQAPYQPPVLLSASMDRTMIMWSPDVASNVWVDSVRMGEAGGNYIQGLFGGVFNNNGNEVLGHGFHGAFHLWKRDADSTDPDATTAPLIGSKWRPHLSMTGHFGPVRDMSWEPTRGAYLTTASDDQTVRIVAPCCKEGVVQDGTTQVVRKTPVGWHEMARPQIHGYDMRTLCCVAPDVIASAADEKVIRVFQAPSTTLEDLSRFVDNATELPTFAPQLTRQTGGDAVATPTRPMGASIPALGLSNKAVFDVKTDVPTPDLEGNAAFTDMVVLPFADTRLQEPPLEEHLLQNTLWPETHKLYGHGFELVTLATNHKATLLLSSCRATTAEHAVIRAWDTTTWTEQFSLGGHKLTVTRLAFSPNDDWLVSGSRDRQICIYCRIPASHPERSAQASPWEDGESNPASQDHYALVQTLGKAHDRIVWDLVWSPDGTVFASGSRDKVVKFWSRKNPESQEWQQVGKLGKLQDSITALAWHPTRATADVTHVLAVGFDNGHIELYRMTSSAGTSSSSMTWQLLHALDVKLCHTATVRRLEWRPEQRRTASAKIPATAESAKLPMLASCSMDGSVRLFNVDILALVG